MKTLVVRKSRLKKEEDPDVPHCAKCGIVSNYLQNKTCFTGNGAERILFIVDTPFDISVLTKALAQVTEPFECNVFNDFWIVSAICCEHTKSPTKAQYMCCLPYLKNMIADLDPIVVVPTGDHAIESVMALFWNDSFKGVDRWRGWNIPIEGRFWLCPTLNPRSVLANRNPVQSRILFNQLNSAFGLADTAVPRLSIPKIIYPETKDDLIYWLDRLKPKWAFDYETNGLKPFPEGSRIHSMAISDGDITISFHMQDEFKTLIKQYLTNTDEKIVANAQFERIWSSTILDCVIENVIHDTMLHSHVKYAMHGANSLKFQSFVQLGVNYYASEVDEFLKADNCSVFNRIHEAPQAKVLEYNGLDAYYTYKLYEKQSKE